MTAARGLGLAANPTGRGFVNSMHRELVSALQTVTRGMPRGDRSALIRGIGAGWGRLREAGQLVAFCHEVAGGDQAKALDRLGLLGAPGAREALERLFTGVHVKGLALGGSPASEAA